MLGHTLPGKRLHLIGGTLPMENWTPAPKSTARRREPVRGSERAPSRLMAGAELGAGTQGTAVPAQKPHGLPLVQQMQPHGAKPPLPSDGYSSQCFLTRGRGRGTAEGWEAGSQTVMAAPGRPL